MSDFSSLLNNFKNSSSKRERTKETTKSDDEKRQRVNDDDDDEEEVIHDLHELSIKIDFLCIGAQKSGTTWLHEMLRKIPSAVGLPKYPMKEVHFWDWNRYKGLGWYSQQFASTNNNIALGEITPCYMALPEHHIYEIRRLFPSVRIVFLARDLVDRAWSAMIMELQNDLRGLKPGEFDTHNDTKETFSSENYDDDYFMGKLNTLTHRARSDYASALSRWLKYFPKEQILILDYTTIATKPRDLLSRVLKHISKEDVEEILQKNITTQDLSSRINTSNIETSKNTIRASLRTKMESYLRPYAIEFNKLLQKNWPDSNNWKLCEYPLKESS
mmetsp:Transcript_25906/g.29623  ORF Transcript_25906/g.29623 Transcript_25906/m.29623 type:complete len:330 (+) Transcript_25906:70-1059(+)